MEDEDSTLRQVSAVFSEPGSFGAKVGSEADDYEEFYILITELQQNINVLRNTTHLARCLQREHLTTTNADDRKSILGRLGNSMEQACSCVRKGKEILEKMKVRIQLLSNPLRSAERRSIENKQIFLTRQFLDAVQGLRVVQRENDEKLRADIVRQLRTVHMDSQSGSCTKTDLELQEMSQRML